MDLSYQPKTGQIINLGYGISTFLEADEEILAQKMFKELETFLNPSMAIPAQWGEGYAHYVIGVIYTKRGEQKLAIEHLAKAKKIGVSKDINRFEYDRELSDLYNHPEFQEIIKPVWPEGYEREE